MTENGTKPLDVEIEHDHMLDLIIEAVAGEKDNNSTSLPMTLLVDGAVVRGKLTSAREWALSFAYSGGKFGETFAEAFAEPWEAERPADFRRRYVHMKDVTVTSGSANFKLPQWRGRLSDINGWTFGS